MKKGDRVVVIGAKREKYNRVPMEFLCHARNMDSGYEWVECWGGKRGYESVIALKPEEIILASGKRRTPVPAS